MNKNTSTAWCNRLARLGAAALMGAAGLAAAAAEPPDVEGEIVVQLRPDIDIGPLLVEHQLSLIGRFGSRPIYRLKVVGHARPKDKIDALRREPGVRSAEPNRGHAAPEALKNLPWAIGEPSAYGSQWALQAIRLAEAHRRSTGHGVRIAVLDTGVDTHHPALLGRLLPGFDFVDHDSDPSEGGSEFNASYGHGTHVAGLVTLVAPDARVMPLRILDPDGRGNAWVLAEAMLHAVDPDGNPSTDDGAHVINLSLGTLVKTNLFKTVSRLVSCKKAKPGSGDADGDDDSDAAEDEIPAVDATRCQAFGGAVVVAAAGNRGRDKPREYPAAEASPALLSVAASSPAGQLAPFSNFGWVKIAAPGEGITSAVPGGGFQAWSGTSMSAPLVAGAAALLRSAERSLPADRVVKRLREHGLGLCRTSTPQLDAAAALDDRSLAVKPTCDKASP